MKKNEKDKKSLGKRIAKITLIVVIVIVCIMICLLAAAYAVYRHYYGKMNYVPPSATTEEIIFDIPDETDETPVTDAPIVTTPPSTQVSTPSTSGEDEPPTTEPPTTTSDEPVYTPPVVSGGVMQFGDHIRNILLIGTDARTSSDRGRSDTMILVSINEKTGQIVMTSFMRDIYLHIPVVDTYNRINAAYAAGGVSLLTATIKENFNIQIDDYIRINFSGFENVINYMGGVDVELSQGEINFVGLEGSATPGIVHLDGKHTLSYCRCRYVSLDGEGGDFARTLRQRKVMTLLFEKLKGMSVFEIGELLDEFLPQVTTNISSNSMLSLLTKAPTYLTYEIKSYRLPVDGSWKYATVRKMSVLSVDFSKNIKALEKIINGTYD